MLFVIHFLQKILPILFVASIADHAAVHDAILARDVDGARAAMTVLIEKVLIVIEQVPVQDSEA